MSFSKSEAVGRARQWANETGKPHLVYKNSFSDHYLAVSLERYESDPEGYKRVDVISVIAPQRPPSVEGK